VYRIANGKTAAAGIAEGYYNSAPPMNGPRASAASDTSDGGSFSFFAALKDKHLIGTDFQEVCPRYRASINQIRQGRRMFDDELVGSTFTTIDHPGIGRVVAEQILKADRKTVARSLGQY
jgi:hypothetical protein